MPDTPTTWRLGPGRGLTLDQPRIMGILNVTPDSFHDGGRLADADAAVARALEMVAEGADIVDVGGESTRPGATRVDEDEQVRRTAPVIAGVRARSDVVISIDTTRSVVARAALDAGADVVNDVSAGTEDDAILDLAAERGCGLVLMHRLRPPDSDVYSDAYATAPDYGNDVVAAVAAALADRAGAALARGVERDRVVLDPGLGFGKTVDQNLALVAGADRLLALGYPLLSAASRKSFIGAVAGGYGPADRLAGSVAVTVLQHLRGVRLFRVHDVAAHRQALAVAAAAAGVLPLPFPTPLGRRSFDGDRHRS